jgi:hypothetical protein
MPVARDAIATAAVAAPSPKLEPPATLAPEARKVWHEIVGRLPAEWFSADNAPLLEQLCNHTVFARRLAADIEALRNVPLDDFETRAQLGPLLKLHTLQTAQMASISTKLRLTVQSHYRGEQAKNIRKATIGDDVPKPWEAWRERRRNADA